MSESGSDQHLRRVPIREAADKPGLAMNLFHDVFETVNRSGDCLFVFLRYISHGLLPFLLITVWPL